jgi:hypothetical protein
MATALQNKQQGFRSRLAREVGPFGVSAAEALSWTQPRDLRIGSFERVGVVRGWGWMAVVWAGGGDADKTGPTEASRGMF